MQYNVGDKVTLNFFPGEGTIRAILYGDGNVIGTPTSTSQSQMICAYWIQTKILGNTDPVFELDGFLSNKSLHARKDNILSVVSKPGTCTCDIQKLLYKGHEEDCPESQVNFLE